MPLFLLSIKTKALQYVIFDLEATCWEEKKGRKNETIEIGAVLVNDKKEIVSEFVQFIKPVIHPKLSPFCTELTSIQQADVDSAPGFLEASTRFKEWFGLGKAPYVLCSWGFYDRNQLESDSEVHGLEADWVAHHISLKHQYHHIRSLRRAVGMKKALANEGFALDGTHHRGIDDARNIAKVSLKYFDEWKYSS